MTDVDIELAEGEVLVVDPLELIYRQITEWMVTAGGVQTYAFGASDADQGKPSYARSSVVTAEESRDWHNQHARSKSIAVFALTVDEVCEEELLVIDDTSCRLPHGLVRSPGHCYIDMRRLTKVELKSVRFRLHERAMERGAVLKAESVPEGQLLP